MEFLDKVKSTFASVAKVSGRESKKLYEIARLKLEITDKKNKEKVLFKEIGMIAYKAYKNGKSVTKRIAPKLEEIDALEQSIETLRNKIELIQSTEEIDPEGFAEEGVSEVEAEIVEVDDVDEIEDLEDDEPETEPID